MKKLIVIITIISLTTLSISCTKRNGDDINRLTTRGLTMLDEWTHTTDFIFYCYANIPFILHNYIENGETIKNYDLDMRPTDNGLWEIYVDEELAYTVNTNKQSLDSIGSKWELTSVAYCTDFGLRQDDNTVNFTITCADTNSWNIYSINEDIPEYFFDANITCKDTPKILQDQALTFSGKGNLYLQPHYEYGYYVVPYFSAKRYSPYIPTLEECVDMYFETETGLRRTTRYWSDGVIDVSVKNEKDQTSSTRAEFERKGYSYKVQITYGGVTEEWPH